MRPFLAAPILAFIACTAPSGAIPSPPGSTASPTATVPAFPAPSYMAALQARGMLRVGYREDAAPFSALAAGRPSGFEAELAREIARDIFGRDVDVERRIEWVPVLSATRLPALEQGRADIVIAGLGITEERQRQVDLTAPYYRTGQRLLVRKTNDSLKDVDDLDLETVCTARGSPSEAAIRATHPGTRLLLLDSLPSCLGALQGGQADVVTTDESILFGFVARDPSTKVVGRPFSVEDWAIGTKKDVGGDRFGLSAFLDRELTSMVADGRWAAAYRASITPLSAEEKRTPF